MRILKYLAGPSLALAVVGLAPGAVPTAEAAPAAAGLLGAERAASGSALETAHYRYRRYSRRPGFYFYVGTPRRHYGYNPYRRYYGYRPYRSYRYW